MDNIRLPPRVKIDLDILQRTNNFPGLERLFKLVNKDNDDITRNDIKSFLDKQK